MYKVEFAERALKSLQKLDKPQVKLILAWISKNLENSSNPKLLGKKLKHNLKYYYRYRIGNYRIIADIQEEKLIILILDVGHRNTIYDYR
ncbi:MAG: type II toxin-antitoxin system RelE family toxin [Acholeplasmatales bacterium]